MIRPVALVLTLLTGFSGLVYEVAWQKYLATLLGSHSEATSAVLGLFLGGLAAGYALFGGVARRAVERAERSGRPPALLLIYGVIEAGIGLYALAFPYLFGAAQRVSFLLPAGHEAVSFAFDVILSALLLLPPTILMGGTIPLLTQALARGLDDATRVHAFVYAFNTAGAFAGSLAAGFVLIHWLGLDGVLRAMGAVNVFAGSLFVAFGLRGPVSAALPALASPLTGVGRRRVAELSLVAGLAGFAMMVLQTTLNRVGALALGSSHFTFAMVVAVFVLCIALGSFGVSALPRIPAWLVAGSQWLLVGLLFLLYLAIPDSGYFAHLLRAFFRDETQVFLPFQIAVFLASLAVLIVPIGLSGALLPLLFHQLRNEVGDLGRMAGSLYSWNTVGSLGGALIGGYLLLFWLDLHHVYAIALGALVIGAGILTVRVARAPLLPSALACAAALGGVLWLPAWDAHNMAVGRFRTREPTQWSFQGAATFFRENNRNTKLLFHDDDPVQTVAVLEARRGDRSMMNNGKSDGSAIGDYPTMCYAAVVPALLADDLERSFVIGWGLGVTVGELARLEDAREVLVAEISPAVLDAAPLFDKWTQQAHTNPKVRMLRRDAYRALLRSEGRFGVISSEPSNPWVTGVEMLYSREFLEAARSRLTPGGVYAQWFHLYEVDAETLEIVARTYASVFERVAIWFANGVDILLIGLNSPTGYPDIETLRARAERPDLRAALERCGAKSFPELLAHELIPPGLLRADRSAGEVHTLRRPILSQHAARAFFSGNSVELPRFSGGPDAAPGRPRALFAREFDGRTIPEPVLGQVARHVCKAGRSLECATWTARWRSSYPASEEARRYDPRGEPGLLRAESLRPESLARIEAMFHGQGENGDDSRPLRRAVDYTNFFSSFYVHAIPFDRAELRDVWNACAGTRVASDCLLKRQTAAERLDRFEVPRVAAGRN